MTKEAILARMAVLGNALSARCPALLAKSDPYKAPGYFMTLGATRCAYLKIREGEDPLRWLYKLEEFAGYFIGGWPELSLLIDRLTIELNVQ